MRALTFSWFASGSLGSTYEEQEILNTHSKFDDQASLLSLNITSRAAHYMKHIGVCSRGWPLGFGFDAWSFMVLRKP